MDLTSDPQIAPKVHGWRARIDSIIQCVLLLAILAAGLQVLQKSLHFIATGPPLNIDDSIGDVSTSLEKYGRYGFLSSPTQGSYEVDRTHAFFNYGPLYFWVGAALVWLFGPSVQLFRMMHPIGLCVIVWICIRTLRRVSLVGPALFAVALFRIYLLSQWPLGRPDIIVSVCIALMLWCAAHALQHASWKGWAGVGFFAASSVTSHQIAAGMIPAAGLIWLFSLVDCPTERPGGWRRQAVTTLAALMLGGALGTLLYLFAIDFRLADLLTLGRAGIAGHSKSFLQAMRDHASFAWGGVTPSRFRILVLLFGLAAGATGSVKFLAFTERRNVLAYVMPPVVAAIVYQVSIGFYGNNHSGYVIASQVTTLWAVGSLIAVGISSAGQRFGSLGLWVVRSAQCLAILAVGFTVAAWARTPSLWEERSAGNVNFEDYIREVTAPLPERAATWGSLYFGVDAGDRTDLVQFLEMFGVTQRDFSPQERPKLAPDFLLLSAYELDATTALALDHQQSLIDTFTALFPTTRYRLARLVYAPPYGTTRVYQRSTQPDPDIQPAITLSVNDGASRQWSGQLSAPIGVTFSPADPVTANLLIYSLKPSRESSSAVAGNLPPGMYLITVEIQRDSPAEAGEILATPGRFFFWRDGYTGYSVPSALYWRGQTIIPMLVDHQGGPLYISRFENAPPPPAASAPDLLVNLYGIRKGPKTQALDEFRGRTGIRVIETRRVLPLADSTGRLKPLEIPPPVSWMRLDPGLSIDGVDGGGIRIAGSAGSERWLLQSGPVSLEANQRFVLSLPTSPMRGALEVGVLNSDGSWLASPTLMARRVVFETQRSTTVTIVITNSTLGESVHLDVTVSPGTLMPVFPKELYVDQLMARRRYGLKPPKSR